MHELLVDFERHCGLGSTRASRLLGHPYVTYAQYRNRTRTLPKHVERHIRLVMSLPNSYLEALIREHVYGD